MSEPPHAYVPDGTPLPDFDLIPAGAIEHWTSDGIECVIRPGFSSINGYARLPAAMRPWWTDYETANDVLDSHWGLSYGPDDHGWVGFDTAHAYDWWAPDDLVAHLDHEGMMCANMMRGILEEHLRRGGGARRWTLATLHAEVEMLATQIAALSLTADPFQVLDTDDTTDGAIPDSTQATPAEDGADG